MAMLAQNRATRIIVSAPWNAMKASTGFMVTPYSALRLRAGPPGGVRDEKDSGGVDGAGGIAAQADSHGPGQHA